MTTRIYDVDIGGGIHHFGAISDIVDYLKQNGLKASDKTIRRHLKGEVTGLQKNNVKITMREKADDKVIEDTKQLILPDEKPKIEQKRKVSKKSPEKIIELLLEKEKIEPPKVSHNNGMDSVAPETPVDVDNVVTEIMVDMKPKNRNRTTIEPEPKPTLQSVLEPIRNVSRKKVFPEYWIMRWLTLTHCWADGPVYIRHAWDPRNKNKDDGDELRRHCDLTEMEHELVRSKMWNQLYRSHPDELITNDHIEELIQMYPHSDARIILAEKKRL